MTKTNTTRMKPSQTVLNVISIFVSLLCGFLTSTLSNNQAIPVITGGLVSIWLFVAVDSFFNQSSRESHTRDINRKINCLSDLIMKSLASNGKVENLGDIAIAHTTLCLLLKKSIRVFDFVSRVDQIDVDRYFTDNGVAAWIDAVNSRLNESSFGSYELIMCDNTTDYYRTILSKQIDPKANQNKFIVRKHKDHVTVPYPNYLLFQYENGEKGIVLGWPFKSGGALGSLFLIEDRDFVEYFYKLWLATIDNSEKYIYENDTNNTNCKTSTPCNY